MEGVFAHFGESVRDLGRTEGVDLYLNTSAFDQEPVDQIGGSYPETHFRSYRNSQLKGVEPPFEGNNHSFVEIWTDLPHAWSVRIPSYLLLNTAVAGARDPVKMAHSK